MKIKFTKLLVLFFFAFLPILNYAVTVTDSAAASNVQVCLKKELVRLQFSVGSTGTTGSYLDIKLPVGFIWEGIAYGPIVAGGSGSNSITYAGVVAGKHRITFGSSTALQTIKLGFWQKANCNAGTSSFTVQDSLYFYEGAGSMNLSATNLFNGTAPSLSITDISHTPTTATIGSNIARKYKVTNGGFGSTSNFIVLDKFSIGGEYTINTSSFYINPSGVNYNVPAGNISTVNDSIIISFDATLIQQIGNLDTLFSNGENFELEYDFTVNTCLVATISSELITAWRCSQYSRCTYYGVNTGISTYGPALPDIVAMPHLLRKIECYDGTTVWRDTFRLRNAGGPATVLNFDATAAYYSSSSRPDLGGAYMDTASFKVKIGKNGTWFKPSYTVIQSISTNYAGIGCNFLGSPAQIRYTIPNLGAGDTLYTILGQVLCNTQMPCKVNVAITNINSIGGTALDFNYRNACGNALFPGFWTVARPFRHQETGLEKTGPGSIGDTESKDLSFDMNAYPTSNGYSNFLNQQRANVQVKITLPNVIVLDPAYTQPVYLRYNSIDYYPHTVSVSGYVTTMTFSANNPWGNLGTELHIKVKGVCDGVTCSGILQYQVEMDVIADSTNCTNRNRWFCANYPIAWTTSCVPCCPKGIINKAYSLTRINFGQPDHDNNSIPSGTLDKSLLKLKRTIPGDTIEVLHKFYVQTEAPSFTQFEYIRSIMNVSSTTYYNVISDSVFIDRTSGTDTIFSMTPNASGANFTSDISFAGPYFQGDTITIKLKLRVIQNPVGGTISYNSQVNGGASRDNFATSFICGAFIDDQSIYGIDNFAYGVGNYITNGCEQTQLTVYNYTRIAGDNDRYSAFKFPYEYRPFVEVKQMRVTIPSGFIVDSVEYYTKNHASPGNYAPYTNMPFTMISPTLVSFRPGALMTSEGGLIIPADEGTVYYFYIYLTPTCKTNNGIPGQYTVGDSVLKIQDLHYQSHPFSNPHSGGTLQNYQPNIITSSAVPISTAYTQNVTWPLSVNNLTSFTASGNWLYFDKPSGLVSVDSLKEGATVLTPDANGFFTIGNISEGVTRNFTVYGKSNSCSYDSIYVYSGYSCKGTPTSFSSTLCNFPPVKLYVQPQPAAIQTQITSLVLTPSDPSNASSTDYGSSTIYMCQSFPFEMEIQATQPGNLYNVKEVLSLPFNGGTGLDYISDSGYIEYPVGTTPRLFSSTANTAILTQVPTGSMTLDLAQIDPTNFGTGTDGLEGTGLGTNATRRVILRWKMKSNCNLVSGDQWQASQQAIAPCGSTAFGNNTITSGFALDLFGVTRPYVASVKIATGLDGCGSQSTQIRLEKIGANPPQPTDSITVRIPKIVAAGTMTCSGVACPGGSGSTQSYSVRTDALYQYITFQYPNTAGSTGDTLLYSFPMTSRLKSTCENNQTVKADVYQQLTIYCGAPIPANLCPNSKSSLGTETKSFDIRKAILGFSGYNSTYIYPSFYKYRFGGNVTNSSTAVSTNAGVTLKTFFDINNNLTYEKNIDSLVKTTVISSPISTSGSVGFIDSFENFRYQPRPTLPLYTVIDTGDASANCFCGGVVQSAFNQALPIEFLELNAQNLNNVTGKIQWITNADNHTLGFTVYRRTENETTFKNTGYIVAQQGNMSQSQYIYYDPISALSEGRIYYQIEAISQDQINKKSKVVSINKTGLMTNANLFSMSPNPSNQYVKINLGEGFIDGEITITNVNGKTVYQGMFKGSESMIKTSEFAQGVYTVSVKTTDLIEVQKLSVIK